MLTDPEEILNFWFYEVGPARWFKEDPALDALVREKFLPAHERAAQDNLREWEENPEGTLALLLLLDTFPRRMFCGTARAYETDDMALDLARRSIIRHFDDRIDRTFKLFFYLPFQHSEHAGDQRLSCFYIRERTKEPSWVDEADRCAMIIGCYGRFPDRNEIMGRPSSPEEMEFLQNKGKM